jgi:hypothetical protein
MKTKELIKKLQEIDPTGEMKIVANCSRFNYPVGIDNPEFGYITKSWDWAMDEDGNDNQEEGNIKVVMIGVDN